MNNFELHGKAQQMADTITAYELAKRVIELEEKLRILERVENIFNSATEVDHALTDSELNKIKAEAVREAITHSVKNDNHQRGSYWAYEVMTSYANKLERGE